MLIRELFERDPKRYIEPIVKVNEHDPMVVRTELEEYVVTELCQRVYAAGFRAFLDRAKATS
jgi:hypothetical protein